jgi:S-adenosyl-L-methionine hydrolase (adenosine-forming)
MPIFTVVRLFLVACLALIMTDLSAIAARATASSNIALFTDFGEEDSYIAQIKGVILTINPNARLIDLMHAVTPFNVTEGSYLLDQCAEEFPAGTIFVAVVDPGVGSDRDAVLVETGKGKYYVGPDNGILTQVIARETLTRAWKLDKTQFYRPDEISRTFHGRDIFGPIAAHLAEGIDPDRLGTPIKLLNLLPDKEATLSGNQIFTEVIHVDHFGNVILNLHSGTDLAARLKDGNLVRMSVGRESFSAPLVKTYSEVEKGRLLLLYSSGGLLEISINQGSAAQRMKVEPGASVYLKP